MSRRRGEMDPRRARRLARTEAILRRRLERDETENGVVPPTPEEIERLCAEIQAGWTEAERAKRRVEQPEIPFLRVIRIRDVFRR